MNVAQRIFKGWLIPGLVPVILGLGAWVGWAWWSRISAPSQTNAIVRTTPVQVQIPQGTATQQIGRELEATGLIRSSKAWDLWARWLQWQDPNGGFKAGTYQLSPTQALPEIAEQIWQGKVVQQSFTIPEGWSLRQMAAYFEEQGFSPQQIFWQPQARFPATSTHGYPLICLI